MERILNITKLNVIEKNRHFSMLITTAINIFILFLFIPEKSNLLVISVDPTIFTQGGPTWVSIYSAWAFGYTLPLIGFFYFRNGIYHDNILGMEQLFLIQGVSRFEYLLGKLLSYYLLLLKMVFWGITGAFVFLKLIYPQNPVPILDFLTPYIPLVFTSLLIASITILFDCIPKLRKSLGSHIFLFLYLTTYALASAPFFYPGYTQPLILKLTEFTGTSLLYRQIDINIFEQTGSPLGVLMFLAVNPKTLLDNYLYFYGLKLGVMDFVNFVGMTSIAVFIVLICSKLNFKEKIPYESPIDDYSENTSFNYYAGHCIKKSNSLLGRIFNEINLMRGNLPSSLFSKLLFVGWIIFSINADISDVQMALCAVLLVFIRMLSESGAREYMYETISLIGSSNKGIPYHLFIKLISNFLMLNLVAFPLMVRMFINRQDDALYVCIVGLIFLSVVAVTSGYLTTKPDLFELFFLVWTFYSYQNVHPLWYMAMTPDTISIPRTNVYLLISIGLTFILYFVARARSK